MNNFVLPLLVKLSDAEKKLLIIIIVILTFVFVLIGLLAKAMTNYMAKKEKEVDIYLSPLCQYRIIKSPKEARKYVARREYKTLFLNLRWFIVISIITIAATLILIKVKYDGDYYLINRAVSGLWFKLDWPKSEFFGIKLISGWPTVIERPNPRLDLLGYVTYAATLSAVSTIVAMLMNSFAYWAKIFRGRKICVAAFSNQINTQ